MSKGTKVVSLVTSNDKARHKYEQARARAQKRVLEMLDDVKKDKPHALIVAYYDGDDAVKAGIFGCSEGELAYLKYVIEERAVQALTRAAMDTLDD